MRFVPIPTTVWNELTLIKFLANRENMTLVGARESIAFKAALGFKVFQDYSFIIACSIGDLVVVSLREGRLAEMGHRFNTTHVVALADRADYQAHSDNLRREIRIETGRREIWEGVGAGRVSQYRPRLKS